MVGLALAGAVAFVIVAIVLLRPAPEGAQAPWVRFNSEDVHSLAFVANDPQHILFGHHAGLEESRDGGRTWSPLSLERDAMGMSTAVDGSIVIAGHDVFVASPDRGTTWAPIDADLPSLDIHAFARDPSDPRRMWAYLATGGLWESTDYGVHWTNVREPIVLFLVAVRDRGATRIFGLDASGLATSIDGGRTWTALTTPPTFPLTGLAASADGMVLYAGATDGLHRSGDGGQSWARTAYRGSAHAIATSSDGRVVAVVSRQTEFFRSDDGGDTWPGP